MKILAVGDVHIEPHTIDDCAALIQFVLQIAKETSPDLVLFLGDQYHHHSILHVPCLAFWKSAFTALRAAGLKVAALIGNHDMTGVEGANCHAMLAHTGDGVKIIDKPTLLGALLLMPYYSDREAFAKECVKYRPPTPEEEEVDQWQGGQFARTVICHQTFQGGTYDNGFYAKDGIDTELIPQEKIISGHIHTPQSWGKTIYLGSPRWRTLSDANVERAIWLMEFEGGRLTKQTPYSTGDVCKRVWHLVDTPEAPISQVFNTKDSYRVDIKGPADYVERRKKELQAPGVRVNCFPDQKSECLQVRESEGVEVAFKKFFGRYEAKYGTDKQILERMVKERLGQ